MKYQLDSRPEILEKLRKLKMLILDIDGVMTDGKIFWINEQGWSRYFSVRDGVGIFSLEANGVDVAVISAGDTVDVRERMRRLRIKNYYLGAENKLEAFEDLVSKASCRMDEMAYMGDEWMDLPVLQRVGFSISVPNAVEEVKKKVDYVTETPGGEGAIREITDAILVAKGIELYGDSHVRRPELSPAP